jgi:serine/threonine protein kinase
MKETEYDEFPRALKDDEPVVIDEWKILHVIGEGGMGKVYGGVLKDHTYAAIKMINSEDLTPSKLARFDQEVDAMRLVNSSYIAKLLGASTSNDLPYIAIEYIYGKTFKKLIENNIQITEKEWYILARQVFLALKEIHLRGLTHRDITPSNIMKLNDLQRIKIIDFGLVKTNEVSNQTRQYIVGTIPYMSPEQIQKYTPTPKSDIFSAATTLVHLFTKRHPFADLNSHIPIDKSIINNEPNLTGLSISQKSLCAKLFSKNFDERPNAESVIQEIDSWISKHTISKIPAKKVVAKKIAVKPKPKGSRDPVLLGVIDEFEVAESIIKKESISYMTMLPSQNRNAFNDLEFKSLKRKYNNEVKKLSELLFLLLEDCGTKVFHVDFFSKSMNTSIYMQGFVDSKGVLLAEAISNNFLSNKLSDDQVVYMNQLGWESPKVNVPDYKVSASPNFSIRQQNTAETRKKVASVMAETIYSIYGADLKTEFRVSPISDKLIKSAKQDSKIDLGSDGSFLIKEVTNNQYLKWQLIGLFERDFDGDIILDTLLARHMENNQVFTRVNKNWKMLGVIDNPIKNGIKGIKEKNAYALDKKVIGVFDKLQESGEVALFEDLTKYLNYTPDLSAKFVEQEKLWPLTNDLIVLGDEMSSDFEDYLGLFALCSSNLNSNIVLGLFAKHPQKNVFYGRVDGKWKLLFESPLTYGYEIFFVTKDFINVYDKSLIKPGSTVARKALDPYLHTS